MVMRMALLDSKNTPQVLSESETAQYAGASEICENELGKTSEQALEQLAHL